VTATEVLIELKRRRGRSSAQVGPEHDPNRLRFRLGLELVIALGAPRQDSGTGVGRRTRGVMVRHQPAEFIAPGEPG
jgi:hypothetical protein